MWKVKKKIDSIVMLNFLLQFSEVKPGDEPKTLPLPSNFSELTAAVKNFVSSKTGRDK